MLLQYHLSGTESGTGSMFIDGYNLTSNQGIYLKVGMKVWHHKTMHKKFKYGIPAILLIQIALMAYLHMNL